MTTTAPKNNSRSRSAADRAYDRRRRRTARMADPRLTMAGVPIRERMAKIPFVIVVIALLAAGGVGVLYLNTRTDEVGMRTTESQERSVDLRLQAESLQRDIAGLDSIAEIARKAREMGMVQAVDPAVIVMTKGSATVIGTPRPAPNPTPVPAAPASGAAATTSPATPTTPAKPTAATTAAATTPATTRAAEPPAAGTTAGAPARTTAVQTKAGQTRAAGTGAAQTRATKAKNSSTQHTNTSKAGR